jgi:hypothetical protein
MFVFLNFTMALYKRYKLTECIPSTKFVIEVLKSHQNIALGMLNL